jgi:hypothetical protein
MIASTYSKVKLKASGALTKCYTKSAKILYQESLFVLRERIHLLISFFRVGQVDCRKVSNLISSSQRVFILFLPAVMISHGNLVYSLLQFMVLGIEVAKVYTVNYVSNVISLEN